MSVTIVEYRGVRGLVYAKVTKDEDGEGNLTFGAVKELAGIATVSKSSESQSEAHYYDNIPAVIVNGNGADRLHLFRCPRSRWFHRESRRFPSFSKRRFHYRMYL